MAMAAGLWVALAGYRKVLAVMEEADGTLNEWVYWNVRQYSDDLLALGLEDGALTPPGWLAAS